MTDYTREQFVTNRLRGQFIIRTMMLGKPEPMKAEVDAYVEKHIEAYLSSGVIPDPLGEMGEIFKRTDAQEGKDAHKD